MRTAVVRGLASSAVAAGLLSGGLLPASAMGTAQTGTGAAAARAGQVTTAGNLHGFRLTYQKANPDGSVTALLRRGRTTVVYLGGGGSRLSLATAAKVVSARVNGKTKRLLRRDLQVGATSPAAQPGTASPVFGPAALASARSVQADLQAAGLTSQAAQHLAGQDAAMARTVLDRSHLATPAASSGGNHGHMSGWCIATLYGDSKNAISNGCDERTVLQNQSGNNYIAEDMTAQASCKGSCDGFLAFNIHLAYSFPADNTVVKEFPNSQQTTGCSPSPPVSISLYNLGFNWSEDTCTGVMNPQGLGGATGVGAYWSGSCGTITCFGDAPLALEQIAEDHTTSSTNPDTTLYVYQQWTTGLTGGGGGSDSGKCKNSCS